MSTLSFHKLWIDAVNYVSPVSELNGDTINDFFFDSQKAFLTDYKLGVIAAQNPSFTRPLIAATFNVRVGFSLSTSHRISFANPFTSGDNGTLVEMSSGVVDDNLWMIGLSFEPDSSAVERAIFLLGISADKYGASQHMANCGEEIRDATGNHSENLSLGSGDFLFGPDGTIYYLLSYSFGYNDSTGTGPSRTTPEGIAIWKFRATSRSSIVRVSRSLVVGHSYFSGGTGTDNTVSRSVQLTSSGRIAVLLQEFPSKYGYISSALNGVEIFNSVESSTFQRFSPTLFLETTDGYFELPRDGEYPDYIKSIDLYDPEWQLVRNYPEHDQGSQLSPWQEQSFQVDQSFAKITIGAYGGANNGQVIYVRTYRGPERIESQFQPGEVRFFTFGYQSLVVNKAQDRFFMSFLDQSYSPSVGVWGVREKSLPGVWTAISADDGTSWRNNERLPTRPAGPTRRSDGKVVDDEYHIYTMAAVQAPTGQTLVGAVHRGVVHDPNETNDDLYSGSSISADSGSRNSLIVANHQGSAATGNEEGVVFKRHRPDLI